MSPAMLVSCPARPERRTVAAGLREGRIERNDLVRCPQFLPPGITVTPW